MAQKPSIPKGTRDFSPLEMMRRQYIFDKIRDVFRTFGFGPLETPAMENLSTLLGKYGDEGDKLLFKILNFSHIVSSVTYGKKINTVGIGYFNACIFTQQLCFVCFLIYQHFFFVSA